MDPVRLGVIGCGVIGKNHMAGADASDKLKIEAIADLREEAANEAAERFSVEKVYDSAEKVLDDSDIEAVVLAMPTGARAGMEIKAFAKGKHVLTEKPVAMNAAAVEEMISRRGDLVAACCSARHRFQESARIATEFVVSGGLGALRLVRARGLRRAGAAPEKTPPPWRLNRAQNGGGILVNWGCYDLDYVLGVTGWTLKPKTVLAQAWGVPKRYIPNVATGSDAESYFAAQILCEDNIALVFERGEYLPVSEEDSAWQVVGEDGSLSLYMTPKEGKKIVHTEADTQEGVQVHTLFEGDESGSHISQCLIEDFADAIRSGGQPSTSLEKALVVQRITDGIYESAAAGAPVDIG